MHGIEQRLDKTTSGYSPGVVLGSNCGIAIKRKGDHANRRTFETWTPMN